MLTVLFFTTVGVAFSDVVIDALMVERGKPLGMTGRFRSIQWGAMYAATLIVGVLGGCLFNHDRQHVSFLICGCFAFGSFLLAYFMVQERERSLMPADPFGRCLAAVMASGRTPGSALGRRLPAGGAGVHA